MGGYETRTNGPRPYRVSEVLYIIPLLWGKVVAIRRSCRIKHLAGRVQKGRRAARRHKELKGDRNRLLREQKKGTRILAELHVIILPGGSQTSAVCHLARTVCRRAEQRTVELRGSEDDPGLPLAVQYLNRLSDLLFVMARTL